MEGVMVREQHKDEDWERLAEQDCKMFPYKTLVAATNNFDPENKLGVEVFESVYKGMLEDGREIAVKKLSKKSEKGMEKFVGEINLLTKLRHPNVVKLRGYAASRDYEPLLVYKYVPSTSLEELFLFSDECNPPSPNRREQINWKWRYKIIKGIANGLNYLHGGSHGRIIIHRNINPRNILLARKWRPIIGGFNRARLLDEDETHVYTHVVGTSGYIAPEYWEDGYLSAKTDIYSFGILVLELISGKRYRSRTYEKDLLDWAHVLYERNRSLEFMDPAFVDSAITEQVTNCIIIGLLCVQGNPKTRPNMDRVVSMLKGNQGIMGIRIGKPGFLGYGEYESIDSDVSLQRPQLLQDAYQASGEAAQNQGNEFEKAVYTGAEVLDYMPVDERQIQHSPSNSNQILKKDKDPLTIGGATQNQVDEYEEAVHVGVEIPDYMLVDKHQIQLSPSNSNQIMKEDEDRHKGHKNENLKKKIAAQNCQKFSYETLYDATKGFASQNVLGQGGFGVVYKGKLDDGREIAVKRSTKMSEEQRKTLIREVELLSSVKHPNVVKLLGYCTDDNECLLVYEYVPNKSLDKLLFSPNGREQELDWTRTYAIIIGTAKGLSYLHGDPQNCIIHRDIKASNILLDHKWVPKIADFGSSRLFDADRTHVSTDAIVGTWGYIAPEYLELRRVSKLTDVYSFGVMVLELVSGKRYYFDPPPQDNAVGLLDWAYKLFKAGKTSEIMDPALANSAIIGQVKKCIEIGLLCTQGNPKLRPNMESVVSMLTDYQGHRKISIGKPGIFGYRSGNLFNQRGQRYRKPLRAFGFWCLRLRNRPGFY